MGADILVMGALHLDVIVNAPALPAPDETMMGKDVAYRFGGKGGNQAVSAARMGGKVAMIGVVGTDDFAQPLRAELARADVDMSMLATCDGASGMSVAIVQNDGSYGAVVVSGVNRQINAQQAKLDPPPKVVVLQNEIPVAENHALLARLPQDVTVIWNAAPALARDAVMIERADILVVNRLEAAMQAGLPHDLPDPEAALAQLATEGRAVIITLGADGYIAQARDGTRFGAKAHRVPVISTHGAGDAFVGALAAEIARGADLAAAAAFAQGAAALHVSTPLEGRANITSAQLRHAFGL